MKRKQFVFNMVSENTYLIWDDETKEAAVIDAGMFYDEEKTEFAHFVSSQGLNLRMVLQTHMHFDHIFGLSFLEEHYGIRPLFHAMDEKLYYSMPEMIRLLGLRNTLILPKASGFVQDKEVIKLGNIEIHTIHTPGHTPGGVCYYIPTEGVLFSGDTLFRNSIGRTDLYGGDYNQEIRSIKERLFILPPNTTVFPGHGEQTTIGDEMSASAWQ